MKLNPLSLIEDLINEHGSSNILRDRLLFLKDELAKVEKERADLATKCSALEKEVASLREQLDKKSIPSEFIERLGVLFKMDSTGSYLPVAHCPDCKRPLHNIEPDVFPYQCSRPGCGYSIHIHENLQNVAK